jgi:hypothetical protein
MKTILICMIITLSFLFGQDGGGGDKKVCYLPDAGLDHGGGNLPLLVTLCECGGNTFPAFEGGGGCLHC